MKILIKFLLYLFLIFDFSNNYYNNVNIKSNSNSSDYNFILEIKSINLKQEVYSFNDKRNNVDKGIYLVKDYDFQSLEGSLLLASHSGNSSISYFKNLNFVKVNDIVSIYKNGYMYNYEIMRTYKINKTGKFKYTNIDKGLYLITCDKKNNKKQLVLYGKLLKISKKSTFY